jgi:spore coat protein U-like protein
MQIKIASGLIALMAFAPLCAAAANTVSRTFTVSVMVVLPECVVSATPMGLNGGNGTIDAVRSVVTVNCNTPVPYYIGLSEGLAAETKAANLGGVALHNYSLKSNRGEEARWGRTIGVALTEPETHTFSVVDPLPVKDEVAAGPRSDTITVTITY